MAVSGRILPGAQNAIGSSSSKFEEGWFTIINASAVPAFIGSGASHASGAVPDPGASAGTSRYLREDGTWAGVAGAAGGTVTSVGLAVPSDLSVSGGPVTGSGTITISRTNQSPNTIMSGPTTGGAATPTFRALVSADIPSLDTSKVTTGTFADARIASASTWNAKEPSISSGTTAQYWRGDKTFQTLDKTAVGLSNVDNTSDVNKPLSTAISNALSGKVNVGVVANNGITSSVVSSTLTLGLGNISPSSVSSGSPFTTGYHDSFKMATDEQLHIRGHLGLSAGVSLVTANDNDSALVPFEIRNSYTAFTSGGVTIGGYSNPGVGSLELNPTLTDGSKRGLQINQAASGTLNGSPSWNQVYISSDVVNTSSQNNFASAFQVYHNFGGGNVVGGRIAISASLQHTAATANTSRPGSHYVAGVFDVSSNVNEGATNNGSDWNGAIYGINPYAHLKAGATAWNVATGAEFNVAVETGASVSYKSLLSLVYHNTDRVQGYNVDCALSISNACGVNSNSQKARVGILMGDQNSLHPVTSATGTPTTVGGALMATRGAASVDTAFDFSSYTVAQFARFNVGSIDLGSHTSLAGYIPIVVDGLQKYIPYYQ